MRATEFTNKQQSIIKGKHQVQLGDLVLHIYEDGQDVDVRVMDGDRQVGYVIFLRDGKLLIPDDISVDEEYRGRGIAKKMYDYVKSLGFKIIRSGVQTNMGKRFWDKNRGEHVDVWEEGVAEGLEQNQEKLRQTLNAWMNKDQQYKDPTQREGFQAEVWPYIQKNIKTILADKGEKGNGDYPAAPYAAWLLVQHMDAYPQNQIEFYNALKQAIPDHPKIQFLRDRAAVNQWIMKNANNPKYFINGKALPNPTVNVRNPAIFKDAGIVATSREEALSNAEQAGNKLLVAAVTATNAQTQPSYKQSVNGSQQGVAEGISNAVIFFRGEPILSQERLNQLKSSIGKPYPILRKEGSAKNIGTYMTNEKIAKGYITVALAGQGKGGAVTKIAVDLKSFQSGDGGIDEAVIITNIAGLVSDQTPNKNDPLRIQDRKKAMLKYLGPGVKKYLNDPLLSDPKIVQSWYNPEFAQQIWNTIKSGKRAETKPGESNILERMNRILGPLAEKIRRDPEVISYFIAHKPNDWVEYNFRMNSDGSGTKVLDVKYYPPAKQGVAEGATVTRIDSKPITDFASNLNTYKHTDDWSQSGLDTGDDSYWTKRNIKPNTSKGLFAGDPHRTALYATGNANETRYVEYTENGQPVVYFDKKDLPAIRARKTYLSIFDASDFRKLPSGEWFSEHPGKPIKQIPINDPFKYIASQGWKIRITNDLNKILKHVQQLHKVGKIAHYGAEGMNESKQDIARGHLKEDVGGNYLYYSVESSDDAKLILSSGYIKASSGAQTATRQQTKLPVVSVSRSIYYAVSGANVERDYQVVFVLDRNAIESRYKTFGTSQHEPTKSDDVFWNANSLNYKNFQKFSKIDTNRDGKMSDQELDAYYAIPGNTTEIDKRPSTVMAQIQNQKYATMLTKYYRSKSGKEFEEVIPVKSRRLPLKGILVGFYLVPNKAAAKDQELLNHPMRLTMPRPNTFAKVTHQGVAEGSIPVYKSPSQFYAGGKKIYQLFRSAFPNLPEHVANDIYNQTSPGTNETIIKVLNQGQDPLKVFLDYYTGVSFNFQKDPGTNLTPEQLKKVLLNGKWKQQILVVNPADFSEHSRNRMINRNFGINPDEDPVRIQRQQSKAKGDGSNEPVIIIQTSSGFVLWEGFHRTMSILSVGKNGNDPLNWNKVKLRAWVVTFETQGLAEAWSEKYKKSINCKNPKGFSQRAHCQGRKKNNEEIELDERKRKRKKKTARYYYGPAYYFGATDTGAEGGDGGGLEEDWKKSLANIGLAGAIGLGAAGGMALKDKVKSALTKPTTQTTQPVQAKPQQVQVSPITNSPLETYLMDVAKKAGLTGIELAQFLGQCAHETLDYKRMIERGTPKYFNKYELKFSPDKAKNLGNIKPGDGIRYKGRGYVQLTGRYNYKMAGKALNLPLEQNPDLAAQPEIAAKIALWYWGKRVRPEIENFADTTSVTRKINPGLSGLEDRHQNFVSYIAQR